MDKYPKGSLFKTRNFSGDEIAKRDLIYIRLFDHPLNVYLATLKEAHSHTPVREICSEGVIPLDDLRDFWWASCRKARLQYGAKISPKS